MNKRVDPSSRAAGMLLLAAALIAIRMSRMPIQFQVENLIILAAAVLMLLGVHALIPAACAALALVPLLVRHYPLHILFSASGFRRMPQIYILLLAALILAAMASASRRDPGRHEPRWFLPGTLVTAGYLYYIFGQYRVLADISSPEYLRALGLTTLAHVAFGISLIIYARRYAYPDSSLEAAADSLSRSTAAKRGPAAGRGQAAALRRGGSEKRGLPRGQDARKSILRDRDAANYILRGQGAEKRSVRNTGAESAFPGRKDDGRPSGAMFDVEPDRGRRKKGGGQDLWDA